MKRTDMKVACGRTSLYVVYRTVYTDGEHFYVKWNNELVNVDSDIESGNYSPAWAVK